ncbi:hypothetical protein SRABI106_02512 [Rahnella aquatilis]|nr:hypothetical protein SRABI106_02512 [Rahnella aquatilis]
MRVQCPVFTDFAAQAELFAVSGQQQFDSGGVKTDAVVERLHVVFGVDTFNGHHGHQHVNRFDQARVTGEQRFDEEWLVGDDHEIDPVARNIDARQISVFFNQFVDLRNHDTVFEGCGFDQRRGVFGACAGIQIAFAVSFETGDQCDVRHQIDVKTGIQFDIGVDRTDFHLTVFQQLRDAQALRTGERKIELTGDATFKEIQMFSAADARHDHM